MNSSLNYCNLRGSSEAPRTLSYYGPEQQLVWTP